MVMPLQEVSRLFGVSAVAVLSGQSKVPSWRVEAIDGTFAVKVYEEEVAARLRFVVTSWLHRAGFPLPVTHVRRGLAHTVLASAWMEGETLAAALTTAPHQVHDLGRAFGHAHAQLHALSVPEHVVTALTTLGPSLPPGCSVLHLDYHPLNVLVQDAQVAAVLDWENVCLGDPRYDVARTLTTLSVDPAIQVLDAGTRRSVRWLRQAYLNGYREAGGSTEDLAPFLTWAGQFMLEDLYHRVGARPLSPSAARR